MSQPIKIVLFIKNIENLWLRFFKVKKCVNQLTPIIEILWKENKNLRKWWICKNHKYFMKTGFTKQKDHLRKIKPLGKEKCISIDKWRDLSLEMLSYKLTEIGLAILKNLFFKKTNIFKIHRQQKLSTKSVDSLSCN